MDAAQRDNRFLRQLGIADPKNFKYPVTILGTGAVGSAAAIALAKMGTPQGLTLIDFDDFEEHNISNQLCLEKAHLGQPKVEAVGDLCQEMGHVGSLMKHKRKLVGDKLINMQDPTGNDQIPARDNIGGIVLNVPDSMDARREMWNLCKYNPLIPYVIDARIAGQWVVIYTSKTMLTADIKRYEETLHSNANATEEPCGARAIIYSSMLVGGIIASLVKRVQLGEPVHQKIVLDTATMGLELTLHNGEYVSNQNELALASVKD